MTTKASIYQVRGTLAALVTESVWDSLLAGKPVGVWEEESGKYSLIRNGEHVRTIDATDDAHAIIKFARGDVAFNQFVLDTANQLPCVDFVYWQVKRGYPVVLDLPAATVQRMQQAKLDSKKIATNMRALATKIHKGMSIQAAAEEILLMGSTREGKA